jgi:hypothetical protein
VAVTDAPGGWFIDMTCPTPEGMVEHHFIELWAEPEIYLYFYEGEVLRFQYWADPVWWINRWFTLSYPEGVSMTILGGIDADAPNPPIYGTYFPPLWVAPGDSTCPLEYSDCFDTKRTGILVSYDEGWSVNVYDSTMGYIGEWDDYTILVDTAVQNTNFRCTDVPSSWYTALIYASMWD